MLMAEFKQSGLDYLSKQNVPLAEIGVEVRYMNDEVE
jgi:hypothetical protein